MYSRYITDRRGDDHFIPAQQPELQMPTSFSPDEPVNYLGNATSPEVPSSGAPDAVPAAKSNSILGNLFGKRNGNKDGKTGLLGGLFGGFDLGDLDIGDIILILILLLLFLDGDDFDFLIVVGLIVLMGI